MERINQHIKKGEFCRMYLLYGTDEYMKKVYKNKLKSAICGEDDGMNISCYSGENLNMDEMISQAQTMPFFSEKRLIIIENSTMFASSNEFPDYFESFPETTYFIFVEEKTDKRSRMYKLVKENGYICEMKGLGEDKLIEFIASCFAKESIGIRRADATYLLGKVGNDMNVIKNECDKIISYMWERRQDGVTRADIDEICSVRLEDKVFEMIDELALGKRDMAMKKYMDLLALREAPLKILRLIVRHFNILLMLDEAKKMELPDSQICQKVKIPSFALRKYMAQLKMYDRDKLMDILNKCVEFDEKFKQGNMSDQMAVDILLCTI